MNHQHLFKDNEELTTEYVFIRIAICDCGKVSVDWWPLNEVPILLSRDGWAKESL